MKNKLVKLSALLLALAVFVTGCGPLKNMKEKINTTYIKSYVAAILDNSYKNDATGFLALKLGTAEEAKKLFDEGIDAEVAGFLSTGASADETALKEWREIMEELFSLTKYEVSQVEAKGDETFDVTIKYSQYKIFESILPDYNKTIREQAESLLSSSASNEEYMSKVMSIYRDFFRKSFADPKYGEEKSITFNIAKNDEGLYQMSEETLQKLESCFIDVEYALTYVDEAVTEESGVKLGKYKGLEVEKVVITITDADVESTVYSVFEQAAETSTHATAEKYDFATIDYVVSENGTPLEGISGKGVYFMIGSEDLIEEIEDGVIGMAVGSSKDIEVVFPKDYGSESLAGKKVIFTVTLKELKSVPELTNELVLATTGYPSLEKFKVFVRETLEEEAEEEMENSFQNAAVEALIKECTFSDSIASDISRYAAMLKANYESYAKNYNMTLEQYLDEAYGVTLGEFEAEMLAYAEITVKGEAALLQVAIAENLTVTDDEYDNYVKGIMESEDFKTPAEVEAAYSKAVLQNAILEDKALELVLGNTIVK